MGQVVRGTTAGNATEVDVDITGARELYLLVVSRWAVSAEWRQPVLEGPRGTARLTDLPWKLARSGGGLTHLGTDGVEGPAKDDAAGRSYGIRVQAPALLVYELPPGYRRFKARGGLDEEGHGSATFMVFAGDPVFAPRDGPTLHTDTHAPTPRPATGHVEMIGGDRLPGTVIGYVRGDETPGGSASHLLVEPAVGVAPPDNSPAKYVRVNDRFVRRIFWGEQPGTIDDVRPGTVYLREGATLQFRSVQFSESHLRLLTSEGIRLVTLAEIARLDMPRLDPWDIYFDELSVLCPDAAGELVWLETRDGLAATTSYTRTVTRPLGESPETIRWHAGVQPAWSLDVLWIDPESIVRLRKNGPEDVPLTRLAPTEAVGHGFLGGGDWKWRVNRNVQGGPLTCGGRSFRWGFGTHASSELRFPLPASVVSLRTRVGLDTIVGHGGCVRARVLLNSAREKPLFESPVIVGSSKVHDTGKLVIESADRKEPTLVLQVDALPTDRPPGADPLDIRDVCNWLEPQLQLNAAALREEIPRRAERAVAAFSDWELDEGSRPLRLANLLAETPSGPGRFVPAAGGRSGKTVLHREIEVGPRTNWLIARAIGRSVAPGNPPRVTVDIDGETAAEFAISPQPVLSGGSPSAAIPLLPYVGKRIRVTVTQTTGHRDDAVHWSELTLREASPPLLTALEEQAEFTSVDEVPGGGAKFVDNDFHTGNRCLRIDTGGRYRLSIPGGVRIREKPEFGEHRWLRFAFRKFGGGRIGLGFEHAEMRERLARYDAGTGPPCHGFARRLWQVTLPPEWIVQVVDVYAHYGTLDIEAIELSVPDGEYALFDHIYFARSPDDFRWLPPGPSVEQTNRIARRTLAKVPREKGLPAVVLVDRGNGQMGAGTIVDGEIGHVLTAGHAIAGSKTTFDVYLADGRKVAARRLGIDRGNDVGALKLEVAQRVPAVEIDFRLHDQYPRDAIYLAASHATDAEPGQDPAEYLVTVRGMVEGSLATDLRLDSHGRGGPLLDAEGRLIGVHTRQTGSGEFLYTRTGDFAAGWPRLIRGDVWGRWLSGVGPKIGVIVSTRPEGCQIIQVTAGTPAAAAGLQPDDWIRRLDGEPVSSLSDMARLLSARDPDEVVTLDIRRERRSFKVKIKLMQHRRQTLERNESTEP